MEWADFKFLVNSKLGHDEWEAHMEGNFIWNGEMYGLIEGQEILVIQKKNQEYRHRKKARGIRETLMEENQRFKAQEKAKAKKEAWDRVLDLYPNWKDWFLDEDERERAMENSSEGNLGDANPFISLSLPDSLELFSLQVPRGNEWAYFTAFIDSYLGEDKWVAGFEYRGEIVPWIKEEYVPRGFQFVSVHMLKEEKKDNPNSLLKTRELASGSNIPDGENSHRGSRRYRKKRTGKTRNQSHPLTTNR
jgi:hypothetical protein